MLLYFPRNGRHSSLRVHDSDAKLRIFFQKTKKLRFFCLCRNYFLPLQSEMIKKDKIMSQIEYVTVKNASRKVLKKMRQIGEEKARRLQKIQERWEAGDYKDVEVVRL